MSALGTVGIADKGNYKASTTYVEGNSVYYGGSTWVALKNNLTGIAPEEGENWKYLARGFGSDSLSQIEGIDTSGVLGNAGSMVISQALVDALADRVMTKLFPIANIVNNGLTTQAGFALDARYGKTLKELLDQTNSNLAKLTWVSVATNIPTGGAPSDTWITLQENTENYKELRFVFGSPKGGAATGWFEYRIRKWLEADWQIETSGSNYSRIRIPQPDGTDCSLEMRTNNGFLIRTTSANYLLRAVYARKG